MQIIKNKGMCTCCGRWNDVKHGLNMYKLVDKSKKSIIADVRRGIFWADKNPVYSYNIINNTDYVLVNSEDKDSNVLIDYEIKHIFRVCDECHNILPTTFGKKWCYNILIIYEDTIQIDNKLQYHIIRQLLYGLLGNGEIKTILHHDVFGNGVVSVISDKDFIYTGYDKVTLGYNDKQIELNFVTKKLADVTRDFLYGIDGIIHIVDSDYEQIGVYNPKLDEYYRDVAYKFSGEKITIPTCILYGNLDVRTTVNYNNIDEVVSVYSLRRIHSILSNVYSNRIFDIAIESDFRRLSAIKYLLDNWKI